MDDELGPNPFRTGSHRWVGVLERKRLEKKQAEKEQMEEERLKKQ